jgi:hypothetical protein
MLTKFGAPRSSKNFPWGCASAYGPIHGVTRGRPLASSDQNAISFYVNARSIGDAGWWTPSRLSSPSNR